MKKTFKRKLLVILLAPALGLPMATASYAATHNTGEAKHSQQGKAGFRDLRASTLIGKDVKNSKGESLGEIKDLIIDVTNERVYYAVLEFGGFLGLGEKLFAYPVRVFKQAADGDDLILNIDQAKLKAAPGFARDNWPDWMSYRSKVDRYYGQTVALKAMPNQKLRRASELIGKDVNDRRGEDVGEIEDIVVNMGNGRIHYAVLDFDKSWNLDDKLLAVPMRAFTFPADREDLVMNVDKSRLDTKVAFDENRWPDLNDPKFLVDVDRYLVSVAPADVNAGTAAPEALFDRLDANNDGMLSQAEAKKDRSVRRAWKNFDKSSKGTVSSDEFISHN